MVSKGEFLQICRATQLWNAGRNFRTTSSQSADFKEKTPNNFVPLYAGITNYGTGQQNAYPVFNHYLDPQVGRSKYLPMAIFC